MMMGKRNTLLPKKEPETLFVKCGRKPQGSINVGGFWYLTSADDPDDP
jgi:hypothetical protein